MSDLAQESRRQTLYQMVDNDGKPSVAAHTMPLWVDKSETDVFSLPTSGNKIESFVTGKEYFEDLIKTCDHATSEIYIAGWQVNWDAQLAEGVRLYDLLLRCARRGVKIYVMPWDDTEPVQTYDDQTKIVLESINHTVSKNGAKLVHVSLCKSFASLNAGYFSHHQKQVVVDRKIAYVGGLDICYGRYDDAKFDLDPSCDGRHVMNRYNPCIPALKTRLEVPLVDPDLMSGPADSFGVKIKGKSYIKSSESDELEKLAAGGWQVPYDKAGPFGVIADSTRLANNSRAGSELDERYQPRMPFQDVHARVEGPAVSSLLANFILRWNAIQEDKSTKLANEIEPSKYTAVGKAQIQVLRSAPRSHCLEEYRWSSGRTIQRGQKDIYVAMKNLIAKSTRFIYIENQFFVSNFGKIGGPTGNLSPAGQFIKDGIGGIDNFTLNQVVRRAAHGGIDDMPKNTILKCLLERLRKAILDDHTKPPFHIYITLPVHPEGPLWDGTVAVQVYYTMQTLVFGSHSLINGIRRLLKARELKDQNDHDFLRVLDAENAEYKTVAQEACFDYVTLLNLRNWKKINKTFVTEQIYVHTKLMIVDDRFALLGSANVNDRSLLGERDSEIAILVMDDETRRADVNGKGSNQPVRVFAHELRMKIWSKLFGITAGKDFQAEDLKNAVANPGSRSSWRAIQRRAKQNAEIYEEAFPFIPRNFSYYSAAVASILPTWDKLDGHDKATLQTPLPSQLEFWKKIFVPKDPIKLSAIKGFITALPLEWTRGENNRIMYPTPLIVQTENVPDVLENSNANVEVAEAGPNFSGRLEKDV